MTYIRYRNTSCIVLAVGWLTGRMWWGCKGEWGRLFTVFLLFRWGWGGGEDMEVRMGWEAGSCQQKKQFRAVRLTYFLR